MDVAALVLSIISLLTSIVIGIYDKSIDKKISKISIASNYFDALFKDIMLKTIPQARKKITIDCNGKLVGSSDIIEVLKNIRSESAFFLYTDKNFYDKLKEASQDLENLILCAEDKILLGEEQTEFLNNISKGISKMYYIMTEKCLNG